MKTKYAVKEPTDRDGRLQYGMTISEIAVVIGKSPKYVNAVLWRAIVKMKKTHLND